MNVKKFTIAELIGLWRLRNGFGASGIDGCTGLVDGYASDDFIRLIIDQRYRQMLAAGPARWFPLANVANQSIIEADRDEGIVTATLPADCGRVVSAKLAEWKTEALILTDADSAMARMQWSPYVRGGTYQPVAVLSGNTLKFYSSSERFPTVEYIMAIPEPGFNPDYYTLSAEALPLLLAPADIEFTNLLNNYQL